MQEQNSQQANPERPNTGWRYRLGMFLFFGAFPVFFATPVIVPMLNLSAAESAALIGGILLAVEVFWFISIPLLGKEGFNKVKQRTFAWFKPSQKPVSRSQHRFAMVVLFASIVLDLLLNLITVASDLLNDSGDLAASQFLGLSISNQVAIYVGVQIFTTLGVIFSLMLLGSGFWGRLKTAFEWHPDSNVAE
jgi:hypothetical protein